jgi:CDP-diacylglycerol--glycerol-3-phosphate 3-phosphatidyltransferase
MNLPNKLTLFRITLIIPFLTLMFISYFNVGKLSYDNFYSTKIMTFFLAGIVFIIAMFTDYIDGYLARKNNQITTFGKLFDPLADKIIINSALIMLVLMKIIPFYLIIIFILRDLIIDGLRNLAASKKINIAASFYGKIKTIILSFGILIIFFIYPMFNKTFLTFNVFSGHYSLYLLNIPIYIASFFSIQSGILYFNQIKEHINIK